MTTLSFKCFGLDYHSSHSHSRKPLTLKELQIFQSTAKPEAEAASKPIILTHSPPPIKYHSRYFISSSQNPQRDRAALRAPSPSMNTLALENCLQIGKQPGIKLMETD